MPLQPLSHVACDPDVVTRGIAVTSNDVDDSFLNAVHASLTGMEQASAKSERFFTSRAFSRRFRNPEIASGCRNFRKDRRSAFALFASFGETAFAV